MSKLEQLRRILPGSEMHRAEHGTDATRVMQFARFFNPGAIADKMQLQPGFANITPENQMLAMGLIVEEVLETVNAMGLKVCVSPEVVWDEKKQLWQQTWRLERAVRPGDFEKGDKDMMVFLTPDVVEVADGLEDLKYVAHFATILLGTPTAMLADEVHWSNMLKLGANGRPVLDSRGKVVKPAGWTPPDIAGALNKFLGRVVF